MSDETVHWQTGIPLDPVTRIMQHLERNGIVSPTTFDVQLYIMAVEAIGLDMPDATARAIAVVRGYRAHPRGAE